jgi:arylsulfatase A-like enzyme
VFVLAHRTRIRSVAPLALAAVLLACQGDSPGSSDRLQGTRGYILISLDTLRADRLSSYGYERPTTPFLDSLADRSILFENAIVQYPSTLTSHMSIFTGLYPSQHSVYPPESILSPEIETLPEAFARAGFRTAGFAEGGYMRGRYGFRRGFETFGSRDRRSRDQMTKTVARGIHFLEELGDDESFFLFLHTYSPHAPYEPPEGYVDLYWKKEIPETFAPTGPRLAEHNATGELLPDDVLSYFSALYDATINYVDDALAELFEHLERLGLDADTTIVITSDHGEEMQEHGKMNHTQIYHETLHVPLIVIHPDLERGERVATLVQSIDIAPTLLGLAGIEPSMPLPGHDLIETAFNDTTIEQPEAWSHTGKSKRKRSLYRHSDDRLLHLLAFGLEGSSNRRIELYDVTSDPAETTDLSPANKDLAEELLRHLDGASFEEIAAPGTEDLDKELEKRLRGLGYLE